MNWIAESLWLCPKIAAPALDDVGIVILDADNDPLGKQLLPNGACGLTSPLLAYALSKQVGGSPDDFVTIVSRERMSRGHLNSWTKDYLAINAVLHELAHHVEGLAHGIRHEKLHGPIVVNDENLDWLTLDFLSTSSSTPALQQDPWWNHEAQFVRAAIHIAHRSNELEFYTSTEYMQIAGQHYALSPVDAYAERLGDEPRRRANEPLVDLLADDAPTEFVELFDADCRAWQARRTV